MDCLFQRGWHLSVRKKQEFLLSEVTYCGTDGEICAHLFVCPQSFTVQKANLEIYRTRKGQVNKIIDLPELCGLKTYFNSGRPLRETLAYLPEEYEAIPLFTDAVRAIIQSETFLFKERGFSSAEDYQKYWDNNYQNSCRLYSNLQRVRHKWFEHVGCEHRPGSLFNRIKNQNLYSTAKGYWLSGHLTDSFHVIAADLELAGDGSTVITAQGALLRVPDIVCQESTHYMQKLVGKSLCSLKKKEVAELLGGGDGCTHLIETVFDGMETLTLYQKLPTGR